MTPEFKFSIIVPTYNREEHIGNALNSLLAQSYTNFEVLVIDDGSTDNTGEVVKKYQDERIRYFRQENRERGASRNNGMQNAKGDIIGFLDSDDVVLPDHLEQTAAFIHSHPQNEVFVMSFKIEEQGKTVDVILPEDINGNLLRSNVLSCNGVFLRKEIAGQFRFSEDRSLSALEDWELWLRIASVRKIISSPVITSIIVQHDERSVMQTTREKIELRFESFYNHVFSNPDITQYYKGKFGKLRASCETYMALHIAMTKKNKRAAVKHLFRGVSNSPSVIFTRRFYAILKHLL